MKRILLLSVAALLAIVGTIGLMLPVVPQVPFFAAALAIVCAVSKTVRRKIKGTRLFRRYGPDAINKYALLKRLFGNLLDEEG